MSDAPRFTSGRYEHEENILHLWYERPIDVRDEPSVVALFDDAETNWIRTCPAKPYLLVNYRNVRIAPAVTATYTKRIQRIVPLVLGTYRYGVGGNLTGVTVSMGNMGIAAQANIFEDEASARAAIRRARADAKTP